MSKLVKLYQYCGKFIKMKKFYKIISFTYLIILSIALLMPINIISDKGQPSNNTSFIIHLILFFILYLLFYFSFTNKYKFLLFCMMYSVLAEILQIFTSRDFQIFDIMFNLIGVLTSFLFCLIFFKRQ